MLLRDNRVIESFRTLLRAGETSPEVLRRRSLLIAVLMMIAVYPDVIFMKASLSLTNYYFSLEESRQRRVILIKERKNRGPHHGMSDAGGSVFQSEPGAQFMKNTLWSWDSPFWNPYSAAGNYGPETLVDIKTSPLSMLTALLGGSDAAFHVAYLGMTLLGLWCLLCLLSVRFRLGLAATLAGGIMFLLDGYLTANLASNVSQTWLIFPALLLALAEYAHRPRVVPLIGVAFASASILCATFLPTTLLVMTTASVLGASVALGRFLEAGGRSVPGNFAALVRAWTGQAAGVLGGLALVAVLYLPVWEALDYMKTGEFYAARTFITASLFNLISAFSPKHVIEIYNAVPVEALHLIRNFVFHQGIVSALLVSQAVRRWPSGVAPFLIAAAALIVLFGGRAYGVPGIFEAVGLLPVIGHVGEQYLWISISLAVVLIVPFGVEALTAPDSPRRLPLLGMSLTILLALAYSASVWGLKGRAGYYVPILVGILIIGTTLIALGRILQRRPRLYRGVITVALFCELTFYVNHMRFERTDRFGQPPQTVRFLQLNAGLQRVVGFGPFSLPPEFPSAFGLYGIGSMTFNIQPDYFSFWNRLIQPDPKDRWATFSNFSQQPDKENINLAPLDFLGVRYALVNLAFEKQIAFMKGAGWREVLRNTNHSRGGEPGMVLENPHVLPRAWIVPALAERKLTPLDDGASAREIAYTEDPALLQIARSIGVGDTAGAVDDTPVAITRYRHTRVELQVQMARPGVLVLTDTWHPNWSVRVDGAPAHLGRVDEAFRGVALGPGPHRIEMRYRPKTLSLGQAISSLMLLVLVALFLTRRRVDRLLARPAPV